VLITIVWSGVVSLVAYKDRRHDDRPARQRGDEREGLDITVPRRDAYHN
jgi:hypothetical protein